MDSSGGSSGTIGIGGCSAIEHTLCQLLAPQYNRQQVIVTCWIDMAVRLGPRLLTAKPLEPNTKHKTRANPPGGLC
jgi:hypothetical protein